VSTQSQATSGPASVPASAAESQSTPAQESAPGYSMTMLVQSPSTPAQGSAYTPASTPAQGLSSAADSTLTTHVGKTSTIEQLVTATATYPGSSGTESPSAETYSYEPSGAASGSAASTKSTSEAERREFLEYRITEPITDTLTASSTAPTSAPEPSATVGAASRNGGAYMAAAIAAAAGMALL